MNPNRIDPYTMYGQKWSDESDRYTQAGGLMTWNINDTFTLRAALRDNYSQTERTNVNATVNWARKTYTESIYQLGESDYYELATYTYLDSKFNIGPVANTLTTGYSWNGYTRYTSPNNSVSLNLPETFSLFSPYQVPQPAYTIDTLRKQRANTDAYTNIVAGDEIKFTDQWSALIGANDALLTADNYNLSTGAVTSNYDKSKLTPAAAVMYKPIPAITAYLSYIEALEQGGTAPTPSKATP